MKDIQRLIEKARAGAMLVGGMVAILRIGQAWRGSRTVEDETFVGRDGLGEVRVLLMELAEGTPGLVVHDPVGQARTLLNHQE